MPVVPVLGRPDNSLVLDSISPAEQRNAELCVSVLERYQYAFDVTPDGSLVSKYVGKIDLGFGPEMGCIVYHRTLGVLLIVMDFGSIETGKKVESRRFSALREFVGHRDRVDSEIRICADSFDKYRWGSTEEFRLEGGFIRVIDLENTQNSHDVLPALKRSNERSERLGQAEKEAIVIHPLVSVGDIMSRI